jgi:hypothetical protein
MPSAAGKGSVQKWVADRRSHTAKFDGNVTIDGKALGVTEDCAKLITAFAHHFGEAGRGNKERDADRRKGNEDNVTVINLRTRREDAEETKKLANFPGETAVTSGVGRVELIKPLDGRDGLAGERLGFGKGRPSLEAVISEDHPLQSMGVS